MTDNALCGPCQRGQHTACGVGPYMPCECRCRMTAPDPVTDVWELLWTAACGYRDAAGPDRSEARLVDALMPIVRAYGDHRAAEAWDAGYAAAQLDADEEPYSDRPERATWQPRQNPHREAAS